MNTPIDTLPKMLRQAWVWTIFFLAAIPFFPEYIAPLLAIAALIAAVRDAHAAGRPVVVGTLGKLVLLFIAYSAVGILYSDNTFNSVCTWLMWCVMLCGYLALTTVLTDRRRLKAALIGLTLTAGIIGLIGLAQYVAAAFLVPDTPLQFWEWLDARVFELFPMEISLRITGLRVSATFTNPNILAEYLVMVFPFLIYCAFHGNRSHMQMLCRFCLLFAIGGLAFSFSRGGYVALAVIAVAFGILYMRNYPLWLLIGVSVLVLIPAPIMERLLSMSFTDEAVSERLQAWHILFGVIGEHPIFGLGPGIQNVWDALMENGLNVPHAHNLVLQLLAEGGIIALGLFLGMGVVLCRRGIQMLRRNTDGRILGGVFVIFALGFCANSMVEYPLFTPKLVGIFLMVLALSDSAADIFLERFPSPLRNALTFRRRPSKP